MFLSKNPVFSLLKIHSSKTKFLCFFNLLLTFSGLYLLFKKNIKIFFGENPLGSGANFWSRGSYEVQVPTLRPKIFFRQVFALA